MNDFFFSVTLASYILLMYTIHTMHTLSHAQYNRMQHNLAWYHEQELDKLLVLRIKANKEIETYRVQEGHEDLNAKRGESLRHVVR